MFRSIEARSTHPMDDVLDRTRFLQRTILQRYSIHNILYNIDIDIVPTNPTMYLLLHYPRSTKIYI